MLNWKQNWLHLIFCLIDCLIIQEWEKISKEFDSPVIFHHIKKTIVALSINAWKNPLQPFFWSNGKNETTRAFLRWSKSEEINTTNVAYMLWLTEHIQNFLFRYRFPLVEPYMKGIDKSWSSAAVFGVRCFIRIPSFWHKLPVSLREELSGHYFGTDGELLPRVLAWTWKFASTVFKNFSTLYLL